VYRNSVPTSPPISTKHTSRNLWYYAKKDSFG
jgi:hypothetical protein